MTTGLDFTTARVSDLYLYAVPLELDFQGLGVALAFDPDRHMPILHVHLGRDFAAALPLTLTRFEFLMRVAQGALPSSFSKECYEDIISFKTKVLSEYYRATRGRQTQLSVLMSGHDGALTPRPLGIRL